MSHPADWVELDGREEEGGGSILRHALGFSVLTGRPFWIRHIRANRPQPGLRSQHVHSVRAAARLCGARVRGDSVGSTELTFEPGAVRPGDYEVDIGTAGSVTLLLQAILLPVVMGPVETRWVVRGGTDVPWSIPADYFEAILLFQLQRWAQASFRLLRRGYYPAGGGHVELRVRPHGVPPMPLRLDGSGRLVRVEGVAHASCPLRSARVAERMRAAAVNALRRPPDVPVSVRVDYQETASPGAGIVLWATLRDVDDQTVEYRLGASALGERGVPAETVGVRAAQALTEELDAGACADRHLADQLVPFLAWVGGRLRTSALTPHTRASLYVARRFLPEVQWDVREEGLLTATRP
ncbi:MAG: RNA 3'-terminal phosphate cyclase [Acidobacteria bacterium]|nr:RNA 3'-terminal phosphate cyclase [Acidobacteriota bacterium]MDW7984910.1 RNA 3'-terminal phosphate cyclase [Acidobacteriota bacterium]